MRMIVFDWGWTLWNPEKKELMGGALETLKHFKERNFLIAVVALASDGDIERRLEAIAETRVYSLCDSVKVSAQMEKDKLYDELLQEFKLKPKDVIVVDDKIERGIKWGVNSGATAVWIYNKREQGNLGRGIEPHFIINHLSELQNIVRH